MRKTSLFQVAALGLALLGSVAGCGSSTPTVMTATSRVLRGKVPVRTGSARITRIVAINAKTRLTIGSTVPAADGTWTINNMPVGATYRLQIITANNKSRPLVFAKRAGAPAKTNLFRVGTKRSPRVGGLDGPIDVGDLTTQMVDGEEQFVPQQGREPNAQEDFDEDGMPDAMDSDVDGDNTPDEMDNDVDGDGAPDNMQFGDQDGDGITNESDTDMDGDGMPNAMDMDNDNDGMPDAMDMTPNGDEGAAPEDRDGDGVPNSEDTMAPDDGAETEGGTDGGSSETDASVEGDGGT
ncbi:MAG: hypothetical protein U0325_23380 [Polyangiales bacterium]